MDGTMVADQRVLLELATTTIATVRLRIIRQVPQVLLQPSLHLSARPLQ